MTGVRTPFGLVQAHRCRLIAVIERLKIGTPLRGTGMHFFFPLYLSDSTAHSHVASQCNFRSRFRYENKGVCWHQAPKVHFIAYIWNTIT